MKVDVSRSDRIVNRPVARDGQIKAVLFWLLAFCAIGISVVFFAIGTSRPYMGVTLSLSSTGWMVQSVDSNGAGNQAGIRVGDIPVEINGQLAQEFLQKYTKTGQVTDIVIKELTVTGSNGQSKSVDLKQTSPTYRSLTLLAAELLVCIIFWGIASYILFKRPGETAARLFFLCSLAFGLALSANVVADRGIPFAVQIAVFSMLFAPWVLLHFFLVLPEERAWPRKSPVVYLIYILPTITLIFYPFVGYANGQPLPAFRSVRLFEFGAGFLAVLAVAIFNYIRATSPKTRQQMKTIFIGCLAALVPFLVLSVIPGVIWKQYFLPSEVSILLLAFIPLAIGYAIVNQKLMDIDFVVRRGVVYGLISLIMAGILSVAVFFALHYQKSIGTPGNIALAVALGVVATALFGPIKKGIEILVDKFIYRDKYDYRQIIQSLGNSLNSLNDAIEASRLVVNMAVEALNLAGGCLFIRAESNSYQLMAAQGLLADIGKQQIVNLTSQLNADTLFPNPASTTETADIAYIVPIEAGKKEVGWLCLSPKVSRQKFSQDDLYLIQALSSVAATSLLRMLVDARTVIERRKAEEIISRAAQEWRTTFDSIEDMIATIDTNYLILRVNRSFANAVGSTPQELIGRHCYEVIHGTDKPHARCPHMRTLSTGKTESSEFFEPKLDKYVDVTTSPISDRKNNIAGSVHIIKDQTAQRQAQAEQQRLREKAEISSRLAAVGEMAAGIAHEINNPLTGVIGFSQLLAERQDLPQDVKEEVKIIADGSQRVADIVKKLLTFARQSKPIKTSINLNELIDNTLKLRSYVLSTANIEVIAHLDPELPFIVVDPGQIQQVFLNLIVNAEYAMKKAHDKGHLTITSEKLDKNIRIIFQDDGPGISPDNLKRIFEPFFTTKPVGEGTGLGLSLSRSIVLEHNGEMRVESKPGKGATFIIELPLYDKSTEPVAAPQLASKPEAIAQRTARILVVDDEASIRELIKAALTKSGHVVDGISDPHKVLDRIKRATYDVLFLDIRMPGMSGMTLYSEIKEHAPKMADRVIIITGDISSEDIQSFMKQNCLLSISKPFDQREVQKKLSEMLQRMSQND